MSVVRLTESRLRQIIQQEMRTMNQNRARRSGRLSENLGPRRAPQDMEISSAYDLLDIISDEYADDTPKLVDEPIMQSIKELAKMDDMSSEAVYMIFESFLNGGSEADYWADYLEIPDYEKFMVDIVVKSLMSLEEARDLPMEEIKKAAEMLIEEFSSDGTVPGW